MCRFCKISFITSPTINSKPQPDAICSLMASDDKVRDEMRATLQKRGLSCSMVNTSCLLFQRKNWEKCPWHEQRGPAKNV